MVSAINPVSCGHTSNKLWPSGSGPGMAPCTCSIVSGPRLRTVGMSNVEVAWLNNSLGITCIMANLNFSNRNWVRTGAYCEGASALVTMFTISG